MISCYVCLKPVSWAQQVPLRYDADGGEFKPVPDSEKASPAAWARATANAVIRCPHSSAGTAHYLPLSYGQFGPPIVIGFVGESKSGKTHLLGTIVQAIEQNGLQEHGLTHRWLDAPRHKKFVTDHVTPLFSGQGELQRTDRGSLTFADALVVNETGRPPRVLALFDVSGEELALDDDAKEFLYLADALIFVADPHIFGSDDSRVVGDRAFGSVLNVLTQEQLGRVGAAIVLSKADLLRFEDPVTVWLARPVAVDSRASFYESQDVYAYLLRAGADAWVRPYHACSRATLHVASATGGDVVGGQFVRGVHPQRVLGPLLSVMAMTGVITSHEAQRIGL